MNNKYSIIICIKSHKNINLSSNNKSHYLPKTKIFPKIKILKTKASIKKCKKLPNNIKLKFKNIKKKSKSMSKEYNKSAAQISLKNLSKTKNSKNSWLKEDVIYKDYKNNLNFNKLQMKSKRNKSLSKLLNKNQLLWMRSYKRCMNLSKL